MGIKKLLADRFVGLEFTSLQLEGQEKLKAKAVVQVQEKLPQAVLTELEALLPGGTELEIVIQERKAERGR